MMQRVTQAVKSIHNISLQHPSSNDFNERELGLQRELTLLLTNYRLYPPRIESHTQIKPIKRFGHGIVFD